VAEGIITKMLFLAFGFAAMPDSSCLGPQCFLGLRPFCPHIATVLKATAQYTIRSKARVLPPASTTPP